MPATISFFDMEATVTPPTGYMQPFPVTLGPAWQQNDVRLVLVSGAEAAAAGVGEAIQLNPDPPAGFTSAYTMNPSYETRGVYYRRLIAGDSDVSVAWIKPTGWQHFCWSVITARGVDPAAAPVAGALTESISHSVGSTSCTVGSVTVPAAGAMLLFLGAVADPEGTWPSWATSIGAPAGWTNLVATDKSGLTYFAPDTDPSLIVVGKSFAAAGSTGTVTFPVNAGSHAFVGMYVFLRPAPDTSIAVGAA